MKKVLLIIPPLPERTYPGKTMGPDYLITALVANGIAVNVLDLNVIPDENQQELEAVLLSFKPELIGITALSIQADLAHGIAKQVKEIYPQGVVITGGCHETHSWQYTLSVHQHCIDGCVIGDGEETIIEIVNSICKGKIVRPWEIKGLAYFDKNQGKPVSTGIRFIKNLDEFPPTRFRHHPSYDFGVFKGKKTSQVMTTRGCPHACFYCNEATNGCRRRMRYRSLESLRQEFLLLEKESFKAIYFDDSTFSVDLEWSHKIARLAKEFSFVWGCNTRVDALDEATVELFAKCGCDYLFAGIESFSPAILLGMNKTQDPDKYLKAAEDVYRWLRDYGLPSSVFLIFGGPRRNKSGAEPETDEDVLVSLKNAINLGPDYLSMNILRLLPGIPLSFAPQFTCIRPEGKVIHGGHYDAAWLEENNEPDDRSAHPIYRAFEGRGSVVPPQMDPIQCYWVLKSAVNLVNQYNQAHHNQIQIVVDPLFEHYMGKTNMRGKILYNLASFDSLN